MSFDMGKRKIKLVVTTTGSRWFYSVSKLDAGVFFISYGTVSWAKASDCK